MTNPTAVSIRSAGAAVPRLVLLFVLAGLAGPAAGQTCSWFVNATDGDDSNPGSQILPWRSIEYAYNTADDGATVCVAAGEYFYEDDSDGVVLQSDGKSIEFVLRSFAGETAIRLSEKVFTVDVGTGSVRFLADTADRIVLGPGIVNSDDPGQADLLNFMHSFRLVSGTLDISDVTLAVEESVGNTSYVNADNGSKVAPQDAAVEIADGHLAGEIVWSSTGRTYIYSGSGEAQTEQMPLPASIDGSLLRFTHTGSVVFSRALAFDDTTIRFERPGSVEFGESVQLNAATSALEWAGDFAPDIVFSSDLLLTSSSPEPIQIDFSGDGDVTVFRLLAAPGLDVPQKVTLLHEGTGRMDIERADLVSGMGSGPITVSLVNQQGRLVLGTPQEVFRPTGRLENRDRFELGGSIALGIADPEALVNSGQLDLGSFDLLLDGNGTGIRNDGSILTTAPGSPGRVISSADAILAGSGSIPSVEITAGILEIGNHAISGSLQTSGTGRLNVSNGAVLSVTGDVLLNADPSFNSALGEIELVGTRQQLAVTTSGPLPGFSISGSRVTVENQSTTLPEISVASGELNAETESNLDVAGTLRISGGSARIASAGELRFLSGASVSSGMLRIESGMPILWDGPLVNDGGTLEFISPALSPINGSTINLAGSTGLVLPGIRLADSEAEVRIGTPVSLQSNLLLSSGVLLFESGGSLTVPGDVIRTSGRFEPEAGAYLLLNGSSEQLISGFSASVLPSLRLEGSDVRILEPLTILGDISVAAGSTSVAGNVLINIDGAFSHSGGQFTLGDSSSLFASDGVYLESTGFASGSGSIRSASDVLLRAPGLSLDGIELILDAGKDIGVDVQSDLSVRTLTVRSGTTSRFTGPGLAEVTGNISVRSGAEVHLDGADILLSGSQSSPTIFNEGVVRGSGFFRLKGPASMDPFTLSGRGLFGALSVELPDDDASVRVTDTDTLRVSGTVRFLAGGIDTAGRPVRLGYGGQTPGIVLNLENSAESSGVPEGRGFTSSSAPIDIDTNGGSYDLSYVGSLTAPHVAGIELIPGKLRHLAMAAPDAVNQPPVFGLTLEDPLTIRGQLQVTSSSLIRLTNGSLSLPGESAIHRIDGRIVGGFDTLIEGAGATVISTDSTSYIRSITVASPPDAAAVNISGLASADHLHLDDAPLEIRGPRPLRLTSDITLSGGLMSLSTGLKIGGTAGSGSFDAVNAEILLDRGSYISFPSGADITLDPSVSVHLSPDAAGISDDRTGFFMLGAESSIQAPSGIPRLLLDPAEESVESDDIFLSGDLTISDALVHSNGDLYLGSHILRLSEGRFEYNVDGVPFDGPRDEFVGDLANGGGRFEVSGGVDFLLGSDLLIQSANVIIDAPGNLVRLVSTSSETRELHVAALPLELRAGTIDLGANDLRVTGSSANLLVLGNVDVIASGSAMPPPDSHPIIAGDMGAFPFRDTDFGELVVGGSGNASVSVTRPVDIPSLRVDGTVRLPASNEELLISRRLVFGQGGASILAESAADFRLGSGAVVVRRGEGTLARAPVIDGPVDVFYDVSDGDLTGIDTGFEGELATGLELPGSVRRLGILAGGMPGGALNTVRLTSDVSVGELLAVYGGEFDRSLRSVELADDALLAIDQLDSGAPATFSGMNDWSSSGEVDVLLGAREARIDPAAPLLPPDVSIDSLVVVLGRTGGPSMTIRQRIPLSVNELFIAAPGSPGTYRFDGMDILVTNTLDVHNTAMQTSSLAYLETGAGLLIDAGAALSGSVDALIGGDMHLDGAYGGLSLEVAGNLIQSGTVAPSTRLIFSGSDQTWKIPTAVQTGSVELAMNAPAAGPPVLRIVSGDGSTGHLLAVNGTLSLSSGLLDTGEHTIRLDGAGSGFERHPLAGTDEHPASHIVGSVLRRVDAETTGPIEFPTGDNATYRPLALSLTTPLLSDTDLGVRHRSLSFSSRNGLPVESADGVQLRDAARFTWDLTSTVNFAQSQPITVTARLSEPVAGDPESHRLIRRSGGDVSAPWQAVGGEPVVSLVEDGLLVRSVDAAGLLRPDGVTLGIGVPELLYSREGQLQIVNMSGGSARDVLLDGSPLVSVLESGMASGTMRIGLGETGPESVDLTIRDVGDTAIRSEVETTVDADRLTVVGLTTNADDALNAYVSTWNRSTVPAPGMTSLGFMHLDSDVGELRIARDQRGGAPLFSVNNGGESAGPVLLSAEPILLVPEPVSSNDPVEEFRVDLTSVGGSHALLLAADASVFGAAIDSPFLALVLDDGTVRAGTIVTGIPTTGEELPTSFRIGGNYPNPFHTRTTLTFDLPAVADVRLVVVDMLGRVVRRVDAGRLDPGAGRQLKLRAEGLAAGVYVYRIEAAADATRYIGTGTMVVIR